MEPTLMDGETDDDALPWGLGIDWYALSVAWSAVVVACGTVRSILGASGV